LLIIAALALIACYGALIYPYYFNPEQRLGLDHPSHFARMVSAEFLLTVNGLGFIPAFTPAMCAGGFQAVSPNDFTYSALQLISMLTNPLVAAFSVHWLFAVLGGLGTYLLARSQPFSLSRWLAFTGAVLFGFNSFHMARMVEGHLNFHTFMLLPLLTLYLLKASSLEKRQHSIAYILAAAMTAAVILYGGAAHLALPIGFSILLVLGLAISYQSGPSLSKTAAVSLAAIAVTALLCSARLSTTYSFSVNFPRDLYDLQGVQTLSDALLLPITSWLGINVIDPIGPLQGHEFAYSVSPLVIPGLLLALIVAFKQHRRGLLLYAGPAALLFAFVVGVNMASAPWYKIVQELPVISESVSLYRWYSSFMLLLVLVSVIGLRTLPRYQTEVCGLIVLLAVAWQINDSPNWRNLTSLPYAQLLDGLEQSRRDGITPITRIGADFTADGKPIGSNPISDVTFPGGRSQIFCYEPLLGYHCEKLRIDNLRQSNVRYVIGNEFNMKNPACYLYPEANQCKPGDNFRLDQAEALEDFTHYRAWQYELPTYQKVANLITKMSWLAVLATVLWLLVSIWRDPTQRRLSPY
jgi:hypothetical protein